jgi:hypothetical protein
MKTVNLVGFAEFLTYAEKIGYGWNEANKILVDDRAYPEAEMNTMEVNYEYDIEGNERDWSEDTLKIIGGFMKKNNVTEITIVND